MCMKKRIYYVGLIILCMMIAIQSCTDNEVYPIIPDENTYPESDLMIPISLKLDGLFSSKTYTTAPTDYDNITDIPGSNIENSVDTVIVYIFDNTFTCEKILKGSGSSVGPEMVRVGVKHFIAVVNGPAHFTSTPLPSNPEDVSYPVLRQMLTDVSGSLPSSAFLMVGEKLNVALPEERLESNPYHVKLDVERVCAKVTMSFTKTGLALAHNIIIDSVVLFQGADRIYLLDNPGFSNPTTYTLSGKRDAFLPSSGIVTAYPDYISLADSFYTYASACGSDKDKAVYFNIYASVGSTTNKKVAKFYLAEYGVSATDTVYDIRRNYWYDVKVNIKNPGMDSVKITVVASPWNVADPMIDTIGYGGVFTPAVPFKLVKSYTATELGPDKSYAAIISHTKGASYIDFKVTAGAEWTFKLKDNTPRNQNVMASKDAGNTWVDLSYGSTHISGYGTDGDQRVYFYRPYVENAEVNLGPTLYVEIKGKYKQDFVIQPRDTMPIPTNSYILRPLLSGAPTNESRLYIPLAGVFRYWEDFILSNGIFIPNGEIEAELIWKDTPGAIQPIKPGSIRVINPYKRDSAYIYAEAGDVPGNAVIAMKIGGTTYWTFHVWTTDYNPYEAAGQKLYASTKTVFMDRNLGAMVNMYDTDGSARGLLYQFGRKDPFPRSISWISSSPAWYNSTGTQLSSITPPVTPPTASTDLRPLDAIKESIENPMDFYAIGAEWVLNVENNYLWNTKGGNKTAFDPCPEGWRVPVQADPGSSYSPWNGVLPSTLTAGTGDYINGRYSPVLGYYPYSGYIDDSRVITGTANTSYYWTSYPGTVTQGISLYNSTSDVAYSGAPSIIDKSYGASIRCVVDLNYLIRNNGGLFGKEGEALINILK